jgi:hypothetical protein
MKVLDLACTHGHVFEGWFASDDDFRQQQARALIECPLCGSQQVEKRLSAPRLNLGKSAAGPAAAPATAPPAPGASPAWPAGLLQALREAVQRSEDVGERFASEARRMHQGETPPRPIRGQSTPAEAMALLEEGIEVLPLPDLPLLKQTLQ